MPKRARRLCPRQPKRRQAARLKVTTVLDGDDLLAITAPEGKPRVTLRIRLPDRTITAKIMAKSLRKAQAPTISRSCCKGALWPARDHRGRLVCAAEGGKTVIRHGRGGEMRARRAPKALFSLSSHRRGLWRVKEIARRFS